jgi:hypothetical protein
MNKLKTVCYVIGVAQIVLGVLFLFAPGPFMAWMGLAVPPQDTGYMLAMFAARLLVFGGGMFVIARQPNEHRFWIDAMIGIQIIDAAAGAFYTATNIVPIDASAFPMFNAVVFAILLVSLRRFARLELKPA